jgi:hypothetical protein
MSPYRYIGHCRIQYVGHRRIGLDIGVIILYVQILIGNYAEIKDKSESAELWYSLLMQCVDQHDEVISHNASKKTGAFLSGPDHDP